MDVYDVEGQSHYNRKNVVVSVKPVSDFTFSNTCLGDSVKFTNTSTISGSTIASTEWNFGDGNTSAGTANATNTYSTQGNYLVTMITDYPSCSDTVRKTITIDLQNDNQLISTNDTAICLGGSKQILANPGSNFCWTPTTFLNNPNSPSPIATPAQTITYHLTSLSTGTNLITNGNFSLGNTGFTSQYLYTNNNTAAAEYFIGTDPSAWYFAHSPCTDHTSGIGNMMMVNGSAIPNLEVWKTIVPVTTGGMSLSIQRAPAKCTITPMSANAKPAEIMPPCARLIFSGSIGSPPSMT